MNEDLMFKDFDALCGDDIGCFYCGKFKNNFQVICHILSTLKLYFLSIFYNIFTPNKFPVVHIS